MGEDGAVEVETPVVYSKTDKKGKIDITFVRMQSICIDVLN